MKKTEKHLKKLISEMPEYCGNINFSMDSEGLDSVKKRSDEFQIKYIFAAACILILLISVPVAAKLPFVTERMQAMPQAEVQDLADMINALNIPAALFSRSFSEEERVRMKSIREEYENGVFPDEDLLIVSGNEQTDADFYYNRDTGMFILPDSRELTDEELRQYIDFSYKVDYSLQQRALENHVSEEKENNYDITDLEVPEEHKEFIQECLTVLGINDSELTNLHIEEVHDDANISYSYQTGTKILNFSISPGDFWMEEYELEEMQTDEGTDFKKPIDETQNYKSARKALDMMCGDEWTDASAWYYCQSIIPEGYLQNDKYAYIFVDDKGKDLWFSYRYGETYPCRIWISSFERFTDNLERVEEHGFYERLYERTGVKIEGHLIALDIETGKVIEEAINYISDTK